MASHEGEHPRAVAGTFVLNPKGELLLVKSPKWLHGKWIVPGGHVEYGESIAVAAERETLEETGLKARFEAVFAVFESIFDPAFAKKRHFVFLECLLRFDGKGEVKLDGKELTAFVWRTPQEAAKEDLEPSTAKGVAALIEYQKHSRFNGGISKMDSRD